MFQATPLPEGSKPRFYEELNRQLEGLLAGERDFIANAANLSALVFNLVPDLNWAGLYLMRGNDLVLGPFQGKPACVRIPVHPAPRGVCGAAAASRQTQLVRNVHDFPGHIACDSASNAEIVVPLLAGDRVIGVLDIDSPTLARFDEDDQRGFETLAATFLRLSDAPS
ncbi:MAG: GAF domain-containing protein [Betaproteobacteria bacterium]|nr:GAF domain-containing protein [Betaproteobacteria bacterium]